MRISLLPSFILALVLWVLSAFELVQLGIAWATGELASEPFVGPLLTQGTAVDRAIPLVVIAVFAAIVVQLGVQAAAVAGEHRAVSALGDLRPGTHRRLQG
ncbi:MAG TPA: hypothetical protein VFQ76_22040, partial [Longimicrobiaceae bacterium]|nr:hypothetical protein [Longimicrobiaceae bacterium]